MSYKVRIRRSIRRRIVAWNLPDQVFVEILLRLDRDLTENPMAKLVRATQPFEGMIYGFALVDLTNRFREYRFVFEICYDQDEETLLVVNCSYQVFGL